MKKKTIVMLLVITMMTFAACGRSAEEVVNSLIEALESADEAEGDEEDTEKVEKTDVKKSEETETVEEVEVEEEDKAEEVYPIGEVVAEEEFLNYINKKRAEDGLDTFVWDDELFEITSGRVLEYVETNSLPERDVVDCVWAASFEKSPEDADFAKMFESYSDAFLYSMEGYVADAAAIGSCYSGNYWYWIFDANFESKYTYTEMDETIYYAINSVNVRKQPSIDGTKLLSLVKGEAVKVTAQCNETGWYRIQDEEGGIGYVSNNYLSTEKPATEVASNNSGGSLGSTGTVDFASMSEEEFLQFLLEAFGTDSVEDLGNMKHEQAWDNARLLPDILGLVNNARAEAGLGALTWDSSLDGDAMRRAKEISTNFVHENLPSRCGENIFGITSGSNGVSAETCFTNWWNSPGHHDNMLNPSYTRISVAIYFDGSSTYASMLLGL